MLTASSETPEGPKENAVDGLTFDWWIPDVGDPVSAQEWLAVSLPAARDADYFSLAAHTLFTAGASVKPQYWTGAAWADAGPAVTPADNGPLMVTFDLRTSTQYRLLFTGYTQGFRVGVAQLGLSLVLLRGMPLDFRPPLRSNEETETTNPFTVNGQTLGRNVVRQNMTTEIKQLKVTRGWVDEYWEPFIERARLEPFFFRWSEDHAECVYGAMDGDPTADYSMHDTLNVGLRMTGLVR